jgi:hypothetical protein
VRIKKAFETPDGVMEIEGEFSPEEVQVILEVGLNVMYQQGALPFRAGKLVDIAEFHDTPGNG